MYAIRSYYARLDEHLRTRRQIGVQPGSVPDQPVGVPDTHGLADLQIADDAASDQAGDLHHHHVQSFRRADEDAIAFIVPTGGRHVGGMEAAVAVHHREYLTADGNALRVGVQQGQEDADPDDRIGAVV